MYYLNRLFLGLFLLLALDSCSISRSEDPSLIRLSEKEKSLIGRKIWKNEAALDTNLLTFWSPNEEFPSLGIAHFTWHTKGSNPPFQQSFPSLIEFFKRQQVSMPSWLARDYKYCPWETRQLFYEDFQSPKMKSLRKLLKNTVSTQTSFVIKRLDAYLGKAKRIYPPATYRKIRQQFLLVASSSQGVYALIDYTNFKGEGFKAKESYNGSAWGLSQVLLGMHAKQRGYLALKEFVQSADKVLTARVQNAPPERNEQRWLKGWRNRLQTYLKPL